MGWLVLLLAVALLSVMVVTRNLLIGDLQSDISASMLQETQEFETFAAVGRNPETGQPLSGARELLRLHLSRQRPSDNEVLLGVSRNGTFDTLAQSGPGTTNPVTPELGAAIVNAPASRGVAATSRGELRWSRVAITWGVDPGRMPDGYFVVGRLIDPDRAELGTTIRTMSLVSAIGLLLAAGAAWIVSGQLLEPVRLVRSAAAEITEQDLTRRIPVHGRDDIAALSEQFNGMLDRLEGAFGTQRAFIDDASHELRTPITIIRGHLELMGDDPVERAAVRRLCIDELDRMSRIVDDLLLLAKAERPDFVRPRKVDLAELTSDIDAKVRALGDRHWHLETIGEGSVQVDPQRVTQAVVQLAHNAVQHTDVGAEIRIGSARQADGVSIWITDSGPGVRPEDRRLIFERFARGSTGAARGDAAGAGLGLAIVRAIAEAHGGSVTVHSPPGAGATFGLDLPASPGNTL